MTPCFEKAISTDKSPLLFLGGLPTTRNDRPIPIGAYRKSSSVRPITARRPRFWPGARPGSTTAVSEFATLRKVFRTRRDSASTLGRRATNQILHSWVSRRCHRPARISCTWGIFSDVVGQHLRWTAPTPPCTVDRRPALPLLSHFPGLRHHYGVRVSLESVVPYERSRDNPTHPFR